MPNRVEMPGPYVDRGYSLVAERGGKQAVHSAEVGDHTRRHATPGFLPGGYVREYPLERVEDLDQGQQEPLGLQGMLRLVVGQVRMSGRPGP